MSINWLAHRIKLIPFGGEPDFFNLSILRFKVKSRMSDGVWLLATYSIEPFSREVPDVSAIDFTPILREMSPGVFQLEGVPDGPLYILD